MGSDLLLLFVTLSTSLPLQLHHPLSTLNMAKHAKELRLTYPCLALYTMSTTMCVALTISTTIFIAHIDFHNDARRAQDIYRIQDVHNDIHHTYDIHRLIVDLHRTHDVLPIFQN